VPVLPVRLWQDGAFLFAAGTPAEPDHHLRLLDLAGTASWQWLPLVGPDFPLATYAQRGPLIAWAPHTAGVAVKLERKEAAQGAPPARRRPRRLALLPALLVLLLLVGLLGGNLWYLHHIHKAVTAPPPPPAPLDPTATEQAKSSSSSSNSKPAPRPVDDRDRLARALYEVLIENGGEGEWSNDRAALLARYDRLVRRHPDLAVRPDNERGKIAVAAMSLLALRTDESIEEAVRRGLTGKGFSDRLIKAACEHVREQLAGEVRNRPGPR
jgi:hypothetical protein